MSYLNTLRLAAFGLSLLLAVVVLGLAAHSIQITLTIAEFVFAFEKVAIVAGILTALSLSTMLIVGLIRRGAYTSMVAVELLVLTVLWVLFLAAGALTSQLKDVLFPFGCDSFDLNAAGQGWCREVLALMGCSFVVWIVLFLYTVTLFIFALISQSHGKPVWTTSVEEANMVENHSNELPQPVGVPVYVPAAPVIYAPALAQQQYPMVQQMGPAPGHGGLPQV